MGYKDPIKVSSDNYLLLLGIILVLVFGFIAGCTKNGATEKATASQETANQDSLTHEEIVRRGKYLVTILDCNTCHTPWIMGPQGPHPDMSRMLSGHPASLKMPAPPDLEGPWGWVVARTTTAFAGPWGISYAINLTPHPTGLGNWTEEMFVKALKTGWHTGAADSRRIMPPMPWKAFSHLPEEDLRAIFAYLQTIPPIENKVPEYEPPRANGQ